MKYLEYYRKYKASYPPMASPVFSKRNWWLIALMIIAAFLIEPLIMYKHHRSIPFSFDYYFQQVKYFTSIFAPFCAYLLWTYWRESIKRSRGYQWVGKFEVINKRSSLVFCYLLLAPGGDNALKVSRSFYEKTRVGDFVLVRRDALGSIEEVSKVNSVSSRLYKSRATHSKA